MIRCIPANRMRALLLEERNLEPGYVQSAFRVFARGRFFCVSSDNYHDPITIQNSWISYGFIVLVVCAWRFPVCHCFEFAGK